MFFNVFDMQIDALICDTLSQTVPITLVICQHHNDEFVRNGRLMSVTDLLVPLELPHAWVVDRLIY